MNTLKRRHRILLFFLFIVSLLLWAGRSQEAPTPQDSPTVQTTDTDSIIRAEALIGEVMVLHSDNEAFTEADTEVLLFQGPAYYLLEGDVPLEAWNGQVVHVSGDFERLDIYHLLPDDMPRQHFMGIITVDKIVDVSPPGADDVSQMAVTGNEQWVNIACRFGDMPDETPRPLAYFEEIMQNIAPGMDDYWRQTSSDRVNIAGSAAYGWYNLPRSKNLYQRLPTPVALRAMLQDCVDLARAEDNLDLTQYGGINVMLNDKFGCCAWGGRMAVNTGNGSKTFRTTWLPPWAFNSLHVIAHEMGHGWGLPHSSGPYGKTYDSAWDVMSGGTRLLDFCRVGSEQFGCFQVGTIGYHLNMLGWLPEDRVETVTPGETQIFVLDALTTARSTSDTLLINVPVGNSRTFYTAEVRTLTAYDRNVPGEAVVLHEVRPGRASPALVVDADDNGDPNDEGAMWLPGETFEENGIRISVKSRIGTTFIVEVSNNS